ncbi:MAG: P-loop NTPase [Aeromicrobium sp.]|uniref:AAA family ATPase n=1 Tax=Aeromicrobium sp. TaxID=1871063 RepID=UPI003C4B2E38
MTRLLVLGADEAFIARMSVLPGTQLVAIGTERTDWSAFDVVRILDPQSLPDLILLGARVPLTNALGIAAAAHLQYPLIDLVLVGEHSADTAVEAMRAGVRDMVSASSSEACFVEMMRRAEMHGPASATVASPAAASVPSEASRTIVVVSPKGGVGKTSIATNVAIGMAETMPHDVVLVDLDLQFGDVAATLDLAPARTMEDAFGPDAAADNLVLKTMLTAHSSGFFVLCGADSPAANENVTGPQIHRLLEQLSTQFSCVLVDTAAGLGEPTLAALEVADEIVLVSTMDVASVRSVRREVDLLTQLGLMPVERSFVLNLADRQSGMKVKDVEAVVGIPVDVVIPRSSAVQLAANHGQPLMLHKKRGEPFVKAIRALLARLERTAPAADNKHRRLEVA